MATTVTLLLFSGRRDLSWELAAEDVAQLIWRLEGLAAAPPVEGLGYRGFLVRSNDPGMPPEAIVQGAPDLERFLLASGSLEPSVVGTVEAAIRMRQ